MCKGTFARGFGPFLSRESLCFLLCRSKRNSVPRSRLMWSVRASLSSATRYLPRVFATEPRMPALNAMACSSGCIFPLVSDKMSWGRARGVERQNTHCHSSNACFQWDKGPHQCCWSV